MLTERQNLILKAIIDTYSKTGEPVGSKTLANDIQASSATIRNDMARLEKEGLLTKTHSSSGRIPTEAGYRYYINHILPRYGGVIDQGLSPKEEEKLAKIFTSPYQELEDVILKSTQTLANLTQYVAITLGPGASYHRFKAFHILPITESKVMAILVTDQDVVESQVFTLQEAFDRDNLTRLERILNEDLVGERLSLVNHKLRTDYAKYFDESVQAMLSDGTVFNHLVKKLEAERLNISGQDQLYRTLSANEDFQTISLINQFLNDRDLVVQVMEGGQEGIQVRMGEDLGPNRLPKLSIMSTSFGQPGSEGAIAVAILGPETMSYLKMAQIFQGMRLALGDYIDHYYHTE